MANSQGMSRHSRLIRPRLPDWCATFRPLIEANYGDMISVTVTNNLPNEGTSMHWHGFLQTGTNAQDGVPGITQCPIPPGSSFTYTFRATLYGSSWVSGGPQAAGIMLRC